jgi:hypothetical protein
MVVNPDMFRKLVFMILGYSSSEIHGNNELTMQYFFGVLIALSIPLIGPLIALIWKLYPEINTFSNLLYWSVFMLTGSSIVLIFTNSPCKFWFFSNSK